MTEEENGTGTGMVLLSFLAGAALGSALAILFNQRAAENDDSSSDDGPLFI